MRAVLFTKRYQDQQRCTGSRRETMTRLPGSSSSIAWATTLPPGKYPGVASIR
jgi:hypothetical protein